MGTLEQLLTGRSYEDIVGDPRSGHAVAERNNGERLVLTLPDSLLSALSGASDEHRPPHVLVVLVATHHAAICARERTPSLMRMRST
jgi:hypothetical protein